MHNSPGPRQNPPLDPLMFKSQQKEKVDPFSKLSKQRLRNHKDWSFSNSPVNMSVSSQHQLQAATLNMNSNLPEIPAVSRSGALSQLQSITRMRQDLNHSRNLGYAGQSMAQLAAQEKPSFKQSGNYRSTDRFSTQLGSQTCTSKSNPKKHVFKNCQSTGRIAPFVSGGSVLAGAREVIQAPMGQKDKARNVVEALSHLNLRDKKSLVDKMKKSNVEMKKRDNLAVITGAGVNAFANYEQERAMAQISTLTAQQARGHGTGFMYSQRLIKNLMSPHSPKQIDSRQLVGRKNIEAMAFESQ
jgi:hypothetical protein